jgi:hypothetical protein
MLLSRKIYRLAEYQLDKKIRRWKIRKKSVGKISNAFRFYSAFFIFPSASLSARLTVASLPTV